MGIKQAMIKRLPEWFNDSGDIVLDPAKALIETYP
jgi:hypothetical protein